MSNTSNLIVRKASINDAQVLAEIGATTFYDTFRPYNTENDMMAYINKAYQLPIIKQNLVHPNIHYYLCEDGHITVGYIKLIHFNSHEQLSKNTIELEKIYVTQTYFGTNAGRMLMEQAINHSKVHHFTTLFLGVWKENERAVKFYQKNGFKVFASREFQLGSRLCEDYMMSLDL